MPINVKKSDIPAQSYNPVKIGEEIAMMTVLGGGVLYVFDDRCRLVTWQEINELSLKPATEPEQQHATTTPDKQPIREIADPRQKKGS